MTSTESATYLPYREPGIITILIQSSFLLVLNVVNHIFDNLIFCGLIGQIFVGVAWGTPGGKLLGLEIEDAIVQLGYLGLILLVYEGGLHTTFKTLKANGILSTAVAATGITVPIGLSFVLLSLVDATPVQAFAAGAALCSTSLGTTFTVLSTSGLSTTRLGVVLSSAAMMDDVVGLVMVQVISNLGGGDFTAITVARPIVVSIGLTITVILCCRFGAKPLNIWFNSQVLAKSDGILGRVWGGTYTSFIIHTTILIALVTASTYAGTSNLFAAYLAGACISWWDHEVPKTAMSFTPTSTSSSKPLPTKKALLDEAQQPGEASSSSNAVDSISTIASRPLPTYSKSSGTATFERFYASALQRILKPLFFASIGFAIPITELFSGPIVWRGIIYSVLMLFAKLVTGLWLVRFSGTFSFSIPLKARMKRMLERRAENQIKTKAGKPGKGKQHASADAMLAGENEVQLQDRHPASQNTVHKAQASANESRKPANPSKKTDHINRPLSLYPATMLGTAMTARGEIGFLIASLAETTGVFSSSSGGRSANSSEIYLIVTWAIVLCTIIGPLSVGTLVKRVKRLEQELEKRGGNGKETGPLGVWGVC